MKPLIVLISVFAVSLVLSKILSGRYQFAQSGRISMAVMLLFTASAHYAFTKGMAMMLPPFIPCPTEIIFLTGVLEIAAAIGILSPNFRVVSGWLLIIFFLLILPANVYAASRHIDYQNPSNSGSGLAYLWFRIPLQLLFIVWTYASAIKRY